MFIIQFFYNSVSTLVDLIFTIFGALIYGILKAFEWLFSLVIGDASSGSNSKMIMLVALAFFVIGFVIFLAFKFSVWIALVLFVIVPSAVFVLKIGLCIWIGYLAFRMMKRAFMTVKIRVTS
ncbi:hypothetical protein RAK27_18250 [Carnobacterium maltaromaticum]|uniref:Uncharacterized protein n=1 Tax=Carnobacterium maltaromaticum TaxID=2751 RepID=A0AAW9K7K9_CARML|nr:hypothetical protein [Carnobacterium maltaromaticum]MDZ5760585.1 hypothetical protein [Carnobacterium maltaromaticum]